MPTEWFAMTETPARTRNRARWAGLALLIAAVAVFLLRTATARHWVGDALVSLVDVWLVPEVRLGGFALDGPTTARLDDLSLVAADGRPILEIEQLTVTLADVPTEGEPLRIARLVLNHPVVHLRADPSQLGFVPLGFSPLLEPDPLADPSTVAPRFRPSQVLELRHLEIIDGVVLFEDQHTTLLELDGISLTVAADPAATPAGTPGHHARVIFGHPPGVVVEADAFFDLDNMVCWLEQGDLSVELSDPNLVRKLSPKAQALIEHHQLQGHIDGSLTGRIDLRSPAASKAHFVMSLSKLHGAAGHWRLPVEHGRIEMDLADGIARISEASAQLLGGTLALRQADVALAESNLALAGELLVKDLHLHKLLREGADDPARQSVLNTAGRVFIASEEMSIGLALESFSLGSPDHTPAFAFRSAEIRDLRPHATGMPLTIAGVSLDGLEVDLRLTDDGVRGLPFPKAPPQADAPAPPSPSAAGPHWSERLTIETIELNNSAVQIAPEAQPPWRLPGISGTLRSFGGSDATALDARLETSAATVQASGTLDLKAPALDFQSWSIRADFGATSARSVLPPGLRDTIVALVPAGTVRGSGSARFPLGTGAPSVELKLDLTEGAVAIPGVRMPVTTGTAILSVQNDATRVANATLKGAGGTLSLPAVVLDAGNRLTLTAEADRVRLDRLRTDAGAKVGMGLLSARMSAAIQLVEHAGQTAIGGLSLADAYISVDGDPLGTLTWNDVDLSMTPDGDQLVVAGSVHSGAGATATLRGHTPIGGDRLTLDALDISFDLSNPSARQALPPSMQVALADIPAGRLALQGDGVISLADPMRGSTAALTLKLEDGVWQSAGYRFAGLNGSAPVGLSDATLRSQGAALSGLGGRFGVDDARWSILDNRGSLRWSLTGLDLQQLSAIEGSPNALEGTVQGGGRVDLKVTSTDGLVTPAGSGRLEVTDGRLLSVPALAVLTRAEDKFGDDAIKVSFQLDPRAATLDPLVIDLGPVRYMGAGEVRWTGGLDVHLEASPRPGERATIADLAARLVAWDIRGTLEDPHAQALPLGIDTRTFDQKAQDPRQRIDDDALPTDSVLRQNEQNLDELPEAGGTVAPAPPDRTEFGDMDDLDELDDF